MSKDYLGEFEELVLLMVMVLKDDAYGLAVVDEFEKQTNRRVTIGAVHATLNRLEDKGYLESFMGDATAERGGRRKRLFKLTASGKKALTHARDIKVNLWTQIPDLAVGDFNKLSL
ncbi:MAG: PadR family transcriptional regulator [Cyclobacteriaceae bacterium]